jgi:hypothetical protein
MKYEHRVHWEAYPDHEKLPEDLADYGSEGWRLVSVAPWVHGASGNVATALLFFFEREVTS